MKVTLYMPYNTYDDGDFDSDYEMSSDEFINRMRDEERMSQNVANDFVMGKRYNSVGSASWNQMSKHNEGKIRLMKCSASLNDAEDKDKSVDDFVAECVSQDVGASIIHVDMDEIDEEFETELNLWNDEHESINKYLDRMGEDWVFQNEPFRNLKVEYLNKAGETKYAEMVNCRILEKKDFTTYVVIYDKITFLTTL